MISKATVSYKTCIVFWLYFVGQPSGSFCDGGIKISDGISGASNLFEEITGSFEAEAYAWIEQYLDELNKNNLRVYKRNLLLESGWSLSVKYEVRGTIYGMLFPSHQLLMVASFMNLLFKVVF